MEICQLTKLIAYRYVDNHHNTVITTDRYNNKNPTTNASRKLSDQKLRLKLSGLFISEKSFFL